MDAAKQVRRRMRETEAALGIFFPIHVRFLTAVELIEEGLARRDWLEVAVSYLILREVLDQLREDEASQN